MLPPDYPTLIENRKSEKAAQAVYKEVRQYLQPEECSCLAGDESCEYCLEVDFWYQLMKAAFYV